MLAYVRRYFYFEVYQNTMADLLMQLVCSQTRMHHTQPEKPRAQSLHHNQAPHRSLLRNEFGFVNSSYVGPFLVCIPFLFRSYPQRLTSFCRADDDVGRVYSA